MAATAPSATRARPRYLKAADLERRAPGLAAYLVETGYATKAELARLRAPRWMAPPPATATIAAGVHFDIDEVDRFLRFCRKLRHIKGRRFAGKPLVPDLWQIVFVIAPTFGWRRADGTRLYRSLYLEIPRKNGKSTLCAAIALWLLACDREPGAEVYSAARDVDQARAVFDVAGNMVLRSPALRKRLTTLIPSRVIRYEATASVYKVLTSDKQGLSKHGLNVHGAVVDELHVITDRELITTLETGTGSRESPLFVFITTAGIPDESPVWMERRDLAIKVAERVVDLEDQLVVIYAADPACATDGTWADPEVWADANPGLGSSLRADYLAGEAAKAAVTPANLNAFLRLHLNVPTESVTGWLPISVWDRTASIVDESDLVGARCYGGLDLASSQDLAALVLVFPDEDDYAADVLCRFWTPADTLKARAHRDRADYETWAKQGFLVATPGETIDLDLVESEVVRLLGAHDLRSLNYDPWGSLQLAGHLEDAGVPLAMLRQGFASISPPMKDTETAVVERRLRHGGHPVLRFCVANTRVVQDPAGNIKPDRKRSTGRIDGTVALIMAVDAWLRDVVGGRSVYEDRGVEVV